MSRILCRCNNAGSHCLDKHLEPVETGPAKVNLSLENGYAKKDGDVDTSPKKKKSNWGISLKEYNKKLRLADKLPSVWEQGTGPDLLQVGGGLGEERDVFHDDSEGDDKHSESGESQESDREEEEDSSDENGSDAKDPHWVFNHFIYHAKQI